MGNALTPPLEHQDQVHAAAVSPDGTRVVTASGDRTARVWDAMTGKPVTAPLEHQGPVTAAVFVVAPGNPDGAAPNVGGCPTGGGTLVRRTSANSGYVESGFQGEPSKLAIVCPFARPCAIQSRTCSDVTGPYSRWSAPTILYMAHV